MESVATEKVENKKVDDIKDESSCEEFKLKRSWTLWEHYEKIGGGKDNNYNANFGKVCWFHDLISMAVACNSIPHFQLSNIFYNDAT